MDDLEAGDEALYRRIKAGDLVAFDVLYARYEARLFGFIMTQVRSRADAEEVFQEAFMRTLKSAEVTFEVGFKCWLFRIARNLVLNRARSSRRAENALNALPESLPDPSAVERLAESERSLALQAAVAKLPAPLSELFRLRTAGLSYDEMAAVLELPLGTLKSRFHQMVVTLREALEPWTAR